MNNTNNTVDLLQIKIEQAKEKLPVETQNAIAAVDWKAAIMALRTKKGYNFEQLGDLELETELLLCGLITPAEYPKELQTRMRISKAETDELVDEMNREVFAKIKAELIKNTERKKIFQNKNSPQDGYPNSLGRGGQTIPPRSDQGRSTPQEGNRNDMQVLQSAGIDPIRDREGSEGPSVSNGTERPVESREEMLKKVENPTPSILKEKIFGSVQTPIVKTEHTLDNISAPVKSSLPKIDPYREIPE